MKSLQEITEIIRCHRDELKARFTVSNVGIFGSYATGRATDASDIDVLVDFDKPISLLMLISLENYLSDITDIKVDVVPKDDLRVELKERILSETIYI
ncbi:MAG: nucleotidyltransferase family protein [Candidatus Magnetominusculus sp. LBB02]|nr:nucleotidyltransferase family protein [Candidatus Magnetominusculus sp. LBB02]